MVKAAVLVSGGGTNLAALLASQDSGVIRSAEIALVAADRPCQALARAEERGIRTVLLDRKSLRREAFEEGLVREIDAAGCTLIVLAGFLSILSAAFVKRYPDRIINVHPSLIPSFCGKGFYGLHVHEAALRRGVRITGATVHLVNEEPDGGRILKQKAVEVLCTDSPESLQKRVMEEAEWIILPQAVEELAAEIEKKGDVNDNRRIS